MLLLNDIYNMDCQQTMDQIDSGSIDCVLTSPPYNMTSRKGGYADKGKRYDSYNDWKTPEEYVKWTVDIFTGFDKILSNNGTVLYNFSYSIENPGLPYTMVAAIIENTPFTVADTIIWKKSNSIPHPASYNRLNRTVEFVYIFARKKEMKSFNCYKEVSKVAPNGQKYYKVVDNFVVAKNNDGSCDLNKATYSSELCTHLLSIYTKDGDVVYDPFMGTGTTAVACKMLNRCYIGSEISAAQVEYAKKRVAGYGKLC